MLKQGGRNGNEKQDGRAYILRAIFVASACSQMMGRMGDHGHT